MEKDLEMAKISYCVYGMFLDWKILDNFSKYFETAGSNSLDHILYL